MMDPNDQLEQQAAVGLWQELFGEIPADMTTEELITFYRNNHERTTSGPL